MSRRREIERRIHALSDIADIMGSLKMLALQEIRVLNRRLRCQAAVLNALEGAAAQLLAHYPQLLGAEARPCHVYVLFGSERGFCGEFNRQVYAQFTAQLSADSAAAYRAVTVGDRLHSQLAGDGAAVARLPGASVAQDIGAVLEALVDALNALRADVGLFDLTAVYHDALRREVRQRRILPPFQTCRVGDGGPFAPLLNLPPRQLYAQLVEQYLFAVFHDIASTSLMAESQKRVEHLEAAIHRIDDRTDRLALKRNALRQEEVTQEIEVILLNAGVDDVPWRQH